MFVKTIIKAHWRALLVGLFLSSTTIGAFISLISEFDTASIAIVVPNKDEQLYVNIIDSLNIYAERINKYGGINRQKLKIHIFEDQGDPSKARILAKEIANANKFIAVLGHFGKKTTSSVISIYEDAKLPIISPTSNIKKSSNWFFQTSPTPKSYGIYMAYYIKKILNRKSAIVIRSNEPDNIITINSFVETFKTLGGRIEKEWEYDIHSKASEISKLVKEIKHSGNLDALDIEDEKALLLATSINDSIPLIVELKRKNAKIQIISTQPAIGDKFGDYHEDKHYPGYFSDGIYAPSMGIFDAFPPSLALVRKDYELRNKNDNISYLSAKTILSASFITKAMESSRPDHHNLLEIRSSIRTNLEKNEWFNEKRQGRESNLAFGIFNRQNLITAPIRPTVFEFGDLSTTSNLKKTIKINESELYPTDVVYTGVSLNRISDIDMEQFTYNLDFFLWFRYQNGIKNASDIEFLNSVEFARLPDALAEAEKHTSGKSKATSNRITAKLVESSSFNGEEYRRYHITGRFKTTNPKNYALGQQNLYVKFRNYAVNVYRLMYVSDFTNNNKGIYSLENVRKTDIEELKFDAIDDESLTLNYAFSYTRNSSKTTLGNPKNAHKSRQFSQFVSEYRVKPIRWSFRGIVSMINEKVSSREDQIDLSLMILLLSISCSIYILTSYFKNEGLLIKFSTYWWLLQLLVVLFILLFGELVISQGLYNIKQSEWGLFNRDIIDKLMHYTIKSIAILWWIIPSYYITSAFDQFLWRPIKRRTGAEIPNVLKLAITLFIYALAILGIMAYVLELTITGLAATSGFIAILFAFASKIDLSNILAGLGISFSNVFKLGDWVKIDGVEGKIVEMTHRSTKILTFDSSIISIPNTSVSSAIIENFNRPELSYRLIIHLETVPDYRFEWVEKILLDAVISTEGTLDNPKPFVIFKGQGDSCQIYEIAFFIKDYSKRLILWQSTWRRIWRHLEQANIKLATPQREIFMPKNSERNMSSPLEIVNNSNAFLNVSDETKTQLLKNAKFCNYIAGDVILQHGEHNNNIFIISEGVVSLSSNNNRFEEKRLGVSDVFGQESETVDFLISARTDVKLLVLNRKDVDFLDE